MSVCKKGRDADLVYFRGNCKKRNKNTNNDITLNNKKKIQGYKERRRKREANRNEVEREQKK